jgi:hypothetical protein
MIFIFLFLKLLNLLKYFIFDVGTSTKTPVEKAL